MKKLQNCIGWSFTADAWSKMAREFFSVNAFLIDLDDKSAPSDHVLTRICLGVKRLDVSTEDTIKTAKDQAEAIKVLSLLKSLVIVVDFPCLVFSWSV